MSGGGSFVREWSHLLCERVWSHLLCERVWSHLLCERVWSHLLCLYIEGCGKGKSGEVVLKVSRETEEEGKNAER